MSVSHPTWSSLQELLQSLHRRTFLSQQQRDAGTPGNIPSGGVLGPHQTPEDEVGEAAEQGLQLDQPGG